jgi:hypothetical protein
MTSSDRKGIGLILIYLALLATLIGVAGKMKMEFHYRETISTAGFIVAAVLVVIAIVMFLFSLRKGQS